MAVIALLCTAASTACATAQPPTYAERLGWPAGTRALIMHVDDAGMSLDSNRGTIRAIEDGVANSLSVMMPTPWVPHMVHWIVKHPRHDAGLHLTLTSEWGNYRWAPLAGRTLVPGLTDQEGALWPTVAQVVDHASADEVAMEIRAQLERARAMGFEPTHLDSHMGTLFANPDYLQRYLQLGMAEGIPVMFPGGHNYFIGKQNPQRADLRQLGEQLWAAGLPVLDDLHNYSYGWPRADKTANYIDAVRQLRPGVTMMILHATEPTEVFPMISDSGPSRLGDLEAMLNPRLAAAIEAEGIVMTTWRELMERRRNASEG